MEVTGIARDDITKVKEKITFPITFGMIIQLMKIWGGGLLQTIH